MRTLKRSWRTTKIAAKDPRLIDEIILVACLTVPGHPPTCHPRCMEGSSVMRENVTLDADERATVASAIDLLVRALLHGNPIDVKAAKTVLSHVETESRFHGDQ